MKKHNILLHFPFWIYFRDHVDDFDDDNDGILDIHDEDDDGDGIFDSEVKQIKEITKQFMIQFILLNDYICLMYLGSRLAAWWSLKIEICMYIVKIWKYLINI